MNSCDILQELLTPGGKPARQLLQYEAFGFVFGNPISQYLYGNRQRGTVSVDRFGVTIDFPQDAPGPIPVVNEKTKVCKDICRWQEQVHFPVLRPQCEEGWETAVARTAEIRAQGKIPTLLMACGIFEQLHNLMGFEDTLTNFYEHPAEMHALIDRILEFRLDYLNLLLDHLPLGAILSHDDWGTRTALFMQPEIWREFFKEPYRKFYQAMRARGVIAIHHADSYLVPIVEDMAEIGIQIWQGVLPENDIPALKQTLKGKMVLMGGIGAAIDRVDATEAEVRDYVRRALIEDCPGGGFIPCITYGAPGTVYPQVDPWINAEIDAYNRGFHLGEATPRVPHRRILNAEVPTADIAVPVSEASARELMTELGNALEKGQKKKVVRLVEEALGENYSAEAILSRGLMSGMNRLGLAFSEGRAFVPEMLMAAKCMNAATDLLKPLLSAGDKASVGKICLGTVKGDHHDIGKNLVKIMMEGAGFTVLDLGSDVPAEEFVRVAAEEHCDIICCSALLTTTMEEMRRVVILAKEAGIREQVLIQIGGAPITQAFCDDIGADLYTEDAAAAARRAVEAMSQKRQSA